MVRASILRSSWRIYVGIHFYRFVKPCRAISNAFFLQGVVYHVLKTIWGLKDPTSVSSSNIQITIARVFWLMSMAFDNQERKSRLLI